MDHLPRQTKPFDEISKVTGEMKIFDQNAHLVTMFSRPSKFVPSNENKAIF